MATRPADIQWDDGPEQPPSAPAASPPSDIQWDDGKAAPSAAPDGSKPATVPTIVSAVRPPDAPKAPLKAQEVDPTYTVAGFNNEVSPDQVYHTGLSDADKKEYAQFFQDPRHPPSAAMLQLWYHQKTGALLANAPEIVDVFRKTGKFNSQEKITMPAKHQTSFGAGLEHTANATVGDYGPEVAGVIDTLGFGGKARPSIWNGDGSLRDLWANNADLERSQLDQDSADHPYASVAGELAGAALTAPLAGGAADAAGAARLAEVSTPGMASAAKAAAGGAVYGSGAAGPGHRLEGAAEGAAIGSATDFAAPYVAKALPVVGRAIADATAPVAPSSEAVAAARGAQDLGIILPKFALSDKDRAAAGALEQTPFGRGPIVNARSAMIDTSQAARDAIAASVGNAPETAAQLGDQVGASAVAANRARRAAASNLYSQAKAASGNIPVPATQTAQTIQNLIDEESQGLGSKTAPILQSLADQLKERGGVLTIDGARDTRTNLRNLLTNEAGATPTNADRITNKVMDSISNDIDNGLSAAGRGDAVPLYQQADAAWAQNRTLEDDVLKPFLGKDFDNWGDDVAKKINADAKGNGTRLAQFLKALPEQDANDTRASIIMGLGRSSDAQQNAAGDAFSLNNLVTNWSQLRGAKRMLFAPETVQALDRLADVANVAKMSERARNHSNTGGVISKLLIGGETTGAMVGFMTGHPKEAIVGALLSALTAARQYGAARLLANPDVAKRIAATPTNLKGAQAFWSRPAWLNTMTVRNPAIAGEIQAFHAAVNDNLRTSQMAASPDADSPAQNKTADNAQP